MSPHLDRIMFNRNENLSTRRPLLQADGGPWRYQVVPPIHRDLRPPPPALGPHARRAPPPTPRLPVRELCDERFLAPQHNSFGKPPLDVRTPRNGYGQRGHEKVTYFNSLAAPPTEAADWPERRQPELVFRFDSSPGSPGGGARDRLPGDPAALFGGGVVHPRLVPPDKDGPFVFGVHSPSQFQLPARLADHDYDYAGAADDTDRTVIKDSPVKCCDRVSDWNARSKAKSLRALNRMFQIKDTRCRSRVSKDRIKCVLVGDGAVGKSSLITAYAQNKFRSEYEPTAFDTFNVVVEVDDRPLCVEICDTAGQDSMSELRALCYPGADVLLLCFSLVRPESFRSVGARWVRAVAGVRAPLVLVGTQADLATDPGVVEQLRLRGEHVVSEAEARALATSINAEYVETSAKLRSGLKDAFDCAILAGLPAKRKPFWTKLFCVK